MKRNRVQRAVFTFAAVVFLAVTLTSALAEEAPLWLLDGVDWLTTTQEMRIIEGLPEEETADGTVVGDYLRYGFVHYKDIPYACHTIYTYRSDLLALYGISIDAFLQADELLMKNVFHEYLLSLGETYGIPGLTDKRQFKDVLSAVEPDPLTMEDVVAYAGWDVDEDTSLLLAQLENEYVDAVYVLFVNEPRVLADGE